jgi:hypothetical protein
VDPPVASPIVCEGQGRLTLGHIPGSMAHLVHGLPSISERRSSQNSTSTHSGEYRTLLPWGMLDMHRCPTSVNMFIDEEVRTHKANANPIFASRPVGRCRSLPGRYFLRGLRLFLGQHRYA